MTIVTRFVATLATLLIPPLYAYSEVPEVPSGDDRDTATAVGSMSWVQSDHGAGLNRNDVRAAHEAGLVSATVIR